MPLDQPTTPASERQPGEFRRHPQSGAPYVADPDRQSLADGRKADLIAKCEQHGLDASGTVPELRERLRDAGHGKPHMVQYGRPSSLGKQIENATNLMKWSERAVVTGLFAEPRLLDTLRPLEVVHQDDDTARNELDRVVARAKDAAQAQIAADRGTHTHAVTEDVDLDGNWLDRAAAGELLGMPVDVQRALADTWSQMLDDNELEILAVEATVVDDVWRQAGTLDRIARLGKPLTFTVHGGERVTLPAGLVVVLDVKGLALDTRLPTPHGWTTMGAVAVGDQVIGSDGRPCNVLFKSAIRNREDCYRITFDDGTTVVADDEHRWLVDDSRHGGGRPRVLTTRELADDLARIRADGGQARQRIAVAEPLDLIDRCLPVDPYTLGLWLADGSKNRCVITKSAGSRVWDRLREVGEELGVEQVDRRTGAVTRTVRGLRARLDAIGVLGDKHVPDIYMRASADQRLALLRGLMDGDGSVNKARRNRVVFTNTNKRLSMAVYELVVSLGDRASMRSVERTGFGLTVMSHDVEWAPLRFNPFSSEKADRTAPRRTGMNHRRLITKIDHVGSVPTQCIAVDSPDHTYLCTESMVVTHNTGKLRTASDGTANYWHGYAVQVASYAQAVPYDPDTDTRGTWEHEIDQRWAIIAHLDVLAALDGEATCRLVLVDLDAGRHAGHLCVAAKQWEKRRDVFSLIAADDHVTRVAVADPDPGSRWKADEPTVRLARDPDEGADVDPTEVAALRDQLGTLDATQNAWIAEHVQASMRAGGSIHLRGRQTVRRVAACRALVTFARAFIYDGSSDHERDDLDHAMRAALAEIVGPDVAHSIAHPTGAIVGSLDADEAERFAAVIADVADLRRHLVWPDTGPPTLAVA